MRKRGTTLLSDWISMSSIRASKSAFLALCPPDLMISVIWLLISARSAEDGGRFVQVEFEASFVRPQLLGLLSEVH